MAPDQYGSLDRDKDKYGYQSLWTLEGSTDEEMRLKEQIESLNDDLEEKGSDGSLKWNQYKIDRDYDDFLHYLNWGTPRLGFLGNNCESRAYALNVSWNTGVRLLALRRNWKGTQ